MRYPGGMPRGVLKDGIGPRLILSNIFLIQNGLYNLDTWYYGGLCQYKSRQKLCLWEAEIL